MSSLPPPNNDQAAGDRGGAAFAALVSPTNRQSHGNNRSASSSTASSVNNNVALFNADDLGEPQLGGDPSNAEDDNDDSNGINDNDNIFTYDGEAINLDAEEYSCSRFYCTISCTYPFQPSHLGDDREHVFEHDALHRHISTVGVRSALGRVKHPLRLDTYSRAFGTDLIHPLTDPRRLAIIRELRRRSDEPDDRASDPITAVDEARMATTIGRIADQEEAQRRAAERRAAQRYVSCEIIIIIKSYCCYYIISILTNKYYPPSHYLCVEMERQQQLIWPIPIMTIMQDVLRMKFRGGIIWTPSAASSMLKTQVCAVPPMKMHSSKSSSSLGLLQVVWIIL